MDSHFVQAIPARSKTLHRKWGLHHSDAALWNELNTYLQTTTGPSNVSVKLKIQPSVALIDPFPTWYISRSLGLNTDAGQLALSTDAVMLKLTPIG